MAVTATVTSRNIIEALRAASVGRGEYLIDGAYRDAIRLGLFEREFRRGTPAHAAAAPKARRLAAAKR